MTTCSICKRELNNSADPLSLDCGGDCVQCMADAGDEDCAKTVREIKETTLRGPSMKLVARVQPDFDADLYDGVLICGDRPHDVYGFTENGWDDYDPDTDPESCVIVDVSLNIDSPKLANRSDLIDALKATGVRVFDTWEDTPAEITSQGPNVVVLDDNWENRILEEHPRVREFLSNDGFDGFRGYVVVCNTEPVLTILWDKTKYSIGEVPASAPAP